MNNERRRQGHVARQSNMIRRRWSSNAAASHESPANVVDQMLNSMIGSQTRAVRVNGRIHAIGGRCDDQIHLAETEIAILRDVDAILD